MSQDETPQLPEPALIERVAGTQNPDWFWRSGDWSVRNLNVARGVVEKTLADFKRILDWGCGCGRILLHLKAAGERCTSSSTGGSTSTSGPTSMREPWTTRTWF